MVIICVITKEPRARLSDLMALVIIVVVVKKKHKKAFLDEDDE